MGKSELEKIPSREPFVVETRNSGENFVLFGATYKKIGDAVRTRIADVRTLLCLKKFTYRRERARGPGEAAFERKF